MCTRIAKSAAIPSSMLPRSSFLPGRFCVMSSPDSHIPPADDPGGTEQSGALAAAPTAETAAVGAAMDDLGVGAAVIDRQWRTCTSTAPPRPSPPQHQGR